jgi:hypothetical protein
LSQCIDGAQREAVSEMRTHSPQLGLAETAVWQTVADVGPSFLTFTMYFNDPNGGHLLGRFR